MNDFIELLRDLLINSSPNSGVAGVTCTSGDFGLDVGMTDGTEFHIEVTQQ